jgi:pyruvate dehydrogenase E2 component (dihydrolipoamide acetyltransferase)
MAEFRMPSLGADMTSGILTEWLVRPGQAVHRGDIVAVVETDKGAIEIEIFEDAIVAELLVAPDTEVVVGAPIARLEDSVSGTGVGTGPGPVTGGIAGIGRGTGAASKPLKPTPPAPSTAPSAPAAAPRTRPARPAPVAAEPRKVARTAEIRRKVSPAARKHAREHGIDLDRVTASGHGEVVTVADVERAIASQAQAPVSAGTAAATPPAPGAVVMTPMRRAIASAMSRSKREIPHYYLAHTFDLEAALRWLEQRNRERPLAERVLPGVLLLKASALAVADAPALNGHWLHEGFVAATRVDLGVIIGLRGGGLAAPTLTDVTRRSLDDLMAALKDVTQRARGGRLKSSELGAASLTVSSLGDSEVETLFPIIHPPQVAIVGFGGIVARPWVVDGGLHVRRVVTATLGADHRASDGHVGARYLAALDRALKNPEGL